MKEFKSFNQQLGILRNRGLIVPRTGQPKRFLEQENYYNVINGYKDLFLQKDQAQRYLIPEQYKVGAHFNELKSLFLLDRDLRSVFMKYILILENSLKTTLAYQFCKKYPRPNSYLEIHNYMEDDPKSVLKQISILTKTIHDKVDKPGPIKHYIENHGAVPLWVLVNFLTIGNISHLYSVLKDSDKNTIAHFYSSKFQKQYNAELKITSEYIQAGLKILNLVRNKCAHDERLFNSDFKNILSKNLVHYFSLEHFNNRKLVVLILY